MQIKKCLIVIAALIFLCPACTANRVARQTPEPSGTPDRDLYGASLDITDWFDADDFSGIADAMKEYGEKSDDGYILFYQHRDYMFGGPGSLDYRLYENSEYEHVRLHYALGDIVYQKLQPDTEHSPVAGARKGRVYYLPAVYDRAASAEPDLAEPAERATAHIQSRMESIRQADVRFRENHVYEKYGISEGDQRQFLISRYAGTLLYESSISMVATIEYFMDLEQFQQIISFCTMHDSQALEQQTYQMDDAIAFTTSNDIIELEAPGRGRYWIAYLPEDSEYIGTVIPRNTLCVYRKDEDDDLDSDALQSAIDDVLEYTNDGTNRFREQTVWVDITEQVSTAEIAALREDIAARQDTDNRGSYSYYSDSHADLQPWRVEGPLSTYGFLRFQVYPLYTRMPYIDIMDFPEGVDRYLFSPPEYEKGHVYARLHQPFADVEYHVQDLVQAVHTAQKELFWEKHRIGVIAAATVFIAVAGFCITRAIQKSREKEPHL